MFKGTLHHLKSLFLDQLCNCSRVEIEIPLKMDTGRKVGLLKKKQDFELVQDQIEADRQNDSRYNING